MIYDISQPIRNDMPLWPGPHNILSLTDSKTHYHDNVHVTRIEMGLHTGTHIDFPYHHISEGKKSHEFSVDYFKGRALVLHCFDKNPITFNSNHLDSILSQEIPDFLLLRTQIKPNTSSVFNSIFPVLDPSTSNLLTTKGIRILGIDSPSVDLPGEEPTNHKILLGNNILLLEGLVLTSVPQGLLYAKVEGKSHRRR